MSKAEPFWPEARSPAPEASAAQRKGLRGVGPGRAILFEYQIEISMPAISLKLPEDLLDASGQCADALRLTRAEYIRRALEAMNRETRARLRAHRLGEASRKVRGESMRVNAEFAAIERDVDA